MRPRPNTGQYLPPPLPLKARGVRSHILNKRGDERGEYVHERLSMFCPALVRQNCVGGGAKGASARGAYEKLFGGREQSVSIFPL